MEIDGHNIVIAPKINFGSPRNPSWNVFMRVNGVWVEIGGVQRLGSPSGKIEFRALGGHRTPRRDNREDAIRDLIERREKRIGKRELIKTPLTKTLRKSARKIDQPGEKT